MKLRDYINNILGVTPYRFAEKIGIHRSTIYQIMNSEIRTCSSKFTEHFLNDVDKSDPVAFVEAIRTKVALIGEQAGAICQPKISMSVKLTDKEFDLFFKTLDAKFCVSLTDDTLIYQDSIVKISFEIDKQLN
jgi:hypothetical protein